MLITFLHKLKIVNGVRLYHFDGEVTLSFKRANPYGSNKYLWHPTAYVHPWTQIGRIVLIPDGRVSKFDNPIEGISYIDRWENL